MLAISHADYSCVHFQKGHMPDFHKLIASSCMNVYGPGFLKEFDFSLHL